LRIPPIFSKAGRKFYIEKEGKRSTNVIKSHSLFDKIPPCFSNPRINTVTVSTKSCAIVFIP
jgi:hypothetical protein